MRVGGGDSADEFGLPARQLPQVPVAAFCLPVVVRADDDKGHVALGGEPGRVPDEISFHQRPGTHDDPGKQDCSLVGEVDLDRHRLTGDEFDLAREFDRPEAKEGVTSFDVGGGRIDDHLPVDPECCSAGLGEREDVGPVDLGHDRGRDAGAVALALDAIDGRTEGKQ